MARYHLTTFGCQMNEHDSERIGGLLTFGIPPFKLEKEVVETRRGIFNRYRVVIGAASISPHCIHVRRSKRQIFNLHG